MADNMIELIARINVNDSAEKINGVDIPALQKAIKGIKIKCDVDTNSINGIQSQLNKLSQTINVNPISSQIVDGNTINSDIDSIIKNFDLFVSKVGSKKEALRQSLVEPIEAFKASYKSGDTEQLAKDWVNLWDVIQRNSKKIYATNEELLQQQTELREALQKIGKVSIDKTSYSDLKYLVGGAKEAQKMMTQVFGVGKWTTKSGGAADPLDAIASQVPSLKIEYNNIAEAIQRFHAILTADVGKDTLIDSIIEKSGDASEAINAMAAALKLPQDIYGETPIGLLADIEKLSELGGTSANNVEHLTTDVQALGTAAKQTETAIDGLFTEAAKSKNVEGISIANMGNTEATLAAAKEQIENATRISEAQQDATNTLQKFTVQVEANEGAVEKWKFAINETGDAYEYLGKTIREADNSTDFRRKDLATQWEIQAQKLIQFANNADKAGLASGALRDDIQQLFATLNNAHPERGGTTGTMNAFLDDFDKAKAKLQALNAETRKDNFANTLSTRIKKLSADMKVYAQANERAVSSVKQMSDGVSFADKWADLTNRMAKGASLTDAELKQLSGDMAVFKKEAQAAGLAGDSAFGKFLNTFKVLTAYISASRVFTMVTRHIRSAVDELKEIDDVLTEISKTSDRTAESLRRLGESSFDVASKYGRTASDYLLGVQEMSRAGFSEFQSESLAEVSLMAQAAGDMTATMANEYIIATNAAYQLKGSEEVLNQVLDSQNYITNRNAVNMENLTEATKIAASQASASGVAIDELTAAVGTMVAVTQQGGNVAGRAFKGILMNLQQVKASASEIGDGDADITTESLTKYEAAVNALGVSLKEVKNGVVQLRSPMEVLRELSIAIQTESEGSIKVANLISAVGGKFRGNQLIALLQNWETYEKMLSEFNSEQAVGSAMKEAEKSANNWAGSINKLKNSWSELINQFVNSNSAINIINTLDEVLQSLSSSSVSTTLGSIAKVITDIIGLLGKVSKAVGVIPTILGLIAAFKGENIKSLTAAFVNLITAEETATAVTNGLKASLNAIGNVAFFWAISKVIGAFRTLKQEAEEAERRQEQAAQAVVDNYKVYQQEASATNNLVQQYIKLVSTTKTLADEKSSLLEIQEKLNETIDDQANKVDTLNNSLAENISLLQKQKLEEAEKTIRETKGQADLARAGLEASYEAVYTNGRKDLVKAYSAASEATGIQIKGTLEEQSKAMQELIDAYAEIEGYNRQYYNSLIEQKEIIDSRVEQMQTIVKVYEEAENVVKNLSLPTEKQELFNKLLEEATSKVNVFSNTENALVKYEMTQDLEAVHQQLVSLIGDNMELKQIVNTAWVSFDEVVNLSTGSIGNLRDAWFESLEEIQKGALKTADSMVDSLEKIMGGEGLSSEDFWNLMKLDTDQILTDITMVGDKFVVNQEQLVKLKDQYIQRQIDSIHTSNEELSANKKIEDSLIRQYELTIERWNFEQKNLNNPQARYEYESVNAKLTEARQKSVDYGEQIRRNNILIMEWESRLGSVLDTQSAVTKQIEKLNQDADNLLKAQRYKIDKIIDGHKDELEALNDEKQALQDELDELEKQKDAIEDIIDNYETVNSLVQNTVQKEIDALEEQKKQIEDTYNKRIDALKEENKEREDALDYAQKLKNLEDANNNRVRVYDEARGWHYASNQDDVKKAQNELTEYRTNKAIEQLEAERDALLEATEDIIDSREKYAEQWKEVSDKIQEEADEELAKEILGADWRDKISKGDIKLLADFTAKYVAHNTKLKNLTNTEIALKKQAIEAKDAEIDAKNKQIETWQKYKQQVEDAAEAIKNSNEEYMQMLDTIKLSEGSNLDEREQNLRQFTDEYSSMMSQINYWQDQLDNGVGNYDFNLHVNGLWELQEAVKYVKELGIEYNAAAIGKYLFDNSQEMDKDDARKMLLAYADASTNIRGYSSGGVADYTGVAMLHGRKNAPETIFNAADSAKLYDLVHNTPNLIGSMLNQATKMAGFNLSRSDNSTSNANSISVNIGSIYANNPSELTQGLDKHLDRYFRTKLTQSYVSK